MLKATRVDGVYDSDPELNKDAKFFDMLSFDDAISKNLKVMDATALTWPEIINFQLKFLI